MLKTLYFQTINTWAISSAGTMFFVERTATTTTSLQANTFSRFLQSLFHPKNEGNPSLSLGTLFWKIYFHNKVGAETL